MSQERGKEVWPAICALPGDNEMLKAASKGEGLPLQTHRVSARTREGGDGGGALLSLLKT